MILVCLVSFLFFTSVLGSSGSTIVTFQCQDATHPNLNTHFFPLATKDGGNSWFSAGDPFTSATPDTPLNDPISCHGNNSLYMITRPKGGDSILKAFDLSNHGKEYLSVSLNPESSQFNWILYHPSGYLLTMVVSVYGTIELPSGKFTPLFDVFNYFTGVNALLRSLTPEGVVSFQVNSPNSDNFTELCGGVGDYCMMSLGALTGLVKNVALLQGAENFWQSTTYLPLQQNISVIYSIPGEDKRNLFTGCEGANGFPYHFASFTGPFGYFPGDFDVYDGLLGQFYYVVNPYSTSKTKVFYQIDVESGKVVQSTNIDASSYLSGCQNSLVYSTSAITYAPNYNG
mmetsp:Transcript_20300/g.28016  ORF Transcript_20300/g.28016 Transcript_20300/m.28016 type:complete len:343 (+) Transcript_20300:69-1097(+)